MRRIWRHNGLSIVLILLFLGTLYGQSVAGFKETNADRRDHARPTIGYGAYLRSPEFLEATTENWESEFFQMAFYVVLTAFLYQKGSAESKDPDAEEPDPVDRDPDPARAGAPYPVRRGGWMSALYAQSLSIALVLLFLISFFLHAVGGASAYNGDQAAHGRSEQLSTFEYMGTSRFWFESLQNWQSEFLAVLSIVVLTIFLRQKGSPESKPVDAAHSATGE